jgi:hypothetical protein
MNYGSDALITARVKSALIDSRELQGHVIKVFTESAVVYLMGVVTEREARLASQIASRTAGVRRVVQAFEIISEAELQRINAALGIERQTGGTSSNPAAIRPAAGQTAPTGTKPATGSPAAQPASGASSQQPGGTVVTPIR